MKIDLRRIGFSLAAPLLALLVAFAVTTVVLFAAGDPVGAVWQQLLKAPLPRVTVNILNEAIILYISAIAVAIGFRMNLFNIGVEGQYRVAVFAAAVVCGQGFVGGPANVVLGIVVAMLAGGMWAGIAGWLKVRRGVSEVISTIMLNAIATGLVAYLLGIVAPSGQTDVTRTSEIPKSSWLTGLALVPGARNTVYTLVFLSVLVGFLYWFVLAHTRFGYDLRAAGRSESAAVASGVDAKKMVLITMVISGAVGGLVGMPLLFGQDHAYGGTFQAGLGFAGIGVALLGRNHPIGIAFGALLWAYLNQQSGPLQLIPVSPEIVSIIQGIIVLAVVIAYEVVRRVEARLEQASVARRLAAGERAGDSRPTSADDRASDARTPADATAGSATTERDHS
ncbi:nucleoside ABC transporter membrane protein [Austwickia chelonae]|uniref:Putative ABC transporter permease protein n=1 Tax=Austwickia chelonae NBRC 105200 TaxID=1184607 RepID=K6W4Q6_9MICO|nr:ABC transporter permease [Austwickia chelonae]GAB76797.1 putative ABC transporter permease protein [Austwickia chelonae NBRC 105200]SEW30843.1 nucleoside ABC transporter membrane protein [Austwickia chelonae]